MLLNKIASRLSDTALFNLWHEIREAGLEDLAFDRMKFAFHCVGMHRPATQEEVAATYPKSLSLEKISTLDNYYVITEFWGGGWFTYDEEKHEVGLDERWLGGIKTSEKLRHATQVATESLMSGHLMYHHKLQFKSAKATLEFLGMKEEFKRDLKPDSRLVKSARELVKLMQDLGCLPEP